MKTFLLGVGAQKAGTTWLHGFLRTHPDCEIAGIKELHAFPTLSEHAENSNIHTERLSALNAAIAVHEAGKGARSTADLANAMDAVSVTLGLPHYLSYFDRIQARTPSASLIGEITPAYSGLSVMRFTRVRDALVDRGYKVRVLFLMRDPVDRCYSALRMGVRNNRGGTKAYDWARENFAANATAEWQEKRTKYDVIIRNLETVFAPEELHYGFYETLFDQEQVDRICDFLNIARRPANLAEKSNVSPSQGSPDMQAIHAVAEHYRGAYDFCSNRFGRDFIHSIWPHAALLD